MMLVTAILKPLALGDVRSGLEDVDVSGMTIGDVSGDGRQRGHTVFYRGADHHVELVPKVCVEVVVDDAAVGRVVDSNRSGRPAPDPETGPPAQAGETGDGKVWVAPVEAVVLRTGERGADAL